MLLGRQRETNRWRRNPRQVEIVHLLQEWAEISGHGGGGVGTLKPGLKPQQHGRVPNKCKASDLGWDLLGGSRPQILAGP